MRIGFDVDGVLASFTRSFTQILHSINSNCPVVMDESQIHSWNYPEFLPVSREDIDKAWDIVNDTHNFWSSLSSVVDLQPIVDFVNNNSHKHDFYFITQRNPTRGISAIHQTIQWLQEQGFKNPQVIATHQKGDTVKLLGIDYYIDDKAENCWDVVLKNTNCKVFCPDYPFNKKATYPIIRVISVLDYIDQIKQEIK